MNTPTQITLSNSLVNNLTSNAPKHNLTSLPGAGSLGDVQDFIN